MTSVGPRRRTIRIRCGLPSSGAGSWHSRGPPPGAERGQVSRAFRHLGSRIDPGGARRIQDRPHAVPPLNTGAVNDPMPRCGTLARARWGLGPVGPVGRILPHKGPPAVRTRPARLALASPAIALHRPAATLRARLFSSSSTRLFNGVNPKGLNLLEGRSEESPFSLAPAARG